MRKEKRGFQCEKKARENESRSNHEAPAVGEGEGTSGAQLCSDNRLI